MENIFEGAKFCDKFVTENGELAIFFRHKGENSNFLLLEHSGGICYEYDDNGRCYEDPEWHCNIVSKYQEPIDEEKLDELAIEKAIENKEYIATSYANRNEQMIMEGYRYGYSYGYRKAKSE